MKIRIASLICLILVAVKPAASQQPTELFLRGYSVIPTPQKVELQDGDIEFDDSWVYDAGRIAKDHIAVRSLLRDLSEFHRIELRPASNQAKNVIRLSAPKDAARAGADPEIEKQGYRLKIAPGLIEIAGAADQGLLYGVQTLLQLLRPGARGRLLAPVSSIEDWPKLQLRFLHCDT